MTETPEEISNKVFSKGIFIGLKGMIILGGHAWPNSIEGEILLWKKAQKKEKKNRTSDKINKSMPNCKPTVTWILWLPCLEVSEKTSRHHRNETNKIKNKENTKAVIVLVLTQKITDLTIKRAEMEAKRGHGLFSTIWNGWNFFNICYWFSLAYRVTKVTKT